MTGINIHLPENVIDHIFKYNPYRQSITKVGDELYAIVNDKKCIDRIIIKSSATEFSLENRHQLGMLHIGNELSNEFMDLVKKYDNDQELGQAVRGLFKAFLQLDSDCEEDMK